jgi:hypothetical protein
LEGTPSNNGMKLTARGASDEARQLIPVFCGRGIKWMSTTAESGSRVSGVVRE